MHTEKVLRLVSRCSQESDDEVVLHRFHLHDPEHYQQSEPIKTAEGDVTSETVPTISSAQTKSNGGSDCPNFLTNEEDTSPPCSPSCEVPPLRDLRKVSQEIFNVAYLERKMDNLRLMKQHHEQIVASCSLFVEVIRKIESGLTNRIQSQKQLITSMISYFSEMQQTLRDHYKTIQKQHIFTNSKSKNNSVIASGLASLAEIYTDYAGCLRKLAKWCEGKLLVDLCQSLKAYTRSLTSGYKQSQKSHSKVVEKLEECQRKFKACADSITQNNKKGADLYCFQLELVGHYHKLKDQMLELYNRVNLNWQLVEGSQNSLLSATKELITSFLQEYSKVYQKSPQSEALETFWREMQLRSNDLFDWVWSTGSSDSMLSLSIRNKQQLDTYSSLQDFRTSLPEELSRFLINKRFQAEVTKEPDGKEWRQAQLLMTIDGNFVILLEGKLSRKLALSRLSCQTIEKRTVVVKENPNRLFGEAIRETIRFRLSEEAEEFVCFCEAHCSASD